MSAIRHEQTGGHGHILVPVSFCLAAMVSIQLAAALSKPVMAQLGVFGTSLVRLSFAALILLIIVRPSFLRYDRSQWYAAFGLGVTMAIMTLCFFSAIETIPLGMAVAIEFLGPLLVATIYGSGRLRFICPLIAAFGVACLSASGDIWANDWKGMLFAFGAAFGWGGYIIFMKHAGQKFQGLEGLAVSMIFTALIALPLGAQELYSGFTPDIFLIAALLAILSPLVPYALEFFALRRMKTSSFGILLSLEPALGATIGFIILGQTLTFVQLTGIALVIIASIISTR
ncbi:EamA family transporter [Paenochrobactrum glaciei]